MFAVKSDLHGIEETVTRPILISVTNDIKKLLGLRNDVFTVYNVKDNIVKQKMPTGEIVGNTGINTDKIMVEYEEMTEDVSGKRLTSARPDFMYIYNDEDVDANIMPIYHSRKFNIRFSYFNKSKSKIFSISNKLKLYTSSDAFDQLHDLEYTYILPNFVNKLLAEINNLKNTREEDVTNKLTLEQYIDKHFDDRIDFANTLDADVSKTDLTIREAQLDIEGYIEDDVDEINPEYDDTEGYWSINFNYQFVYEKPVSLLMKYPLLVYNHVIGKFFRDFHNEKPKKSKNAIRTGRYRELYYLMDRDQPDNDPLTLKHRNYYLKIPSYDKTSLPVVNRAYLRLCSVLIQVDEEDKFSLFNLKEIPGLKLKQKYYDFLIYNRDKISTDCDCMILIDLWKKDRKDYGNKVKLDEFGNLTTTYEMDIKSVYRVTFNLLMDPDLLSARGKQALIRFSKEQEESPIQHTSIYQFGKYYQFMNYQHMRHEMQNPVYWSSNNLTKFKKEIEGGSVILDWLVMRELDPAIVNKILEDSQKFSDVLDNTLAARLNNRMYVLNNNGNNVRTVQTMAALSTVFENKGEQHG